MAGNAQFDREFDWTGPSADPNDEQFGDVVEPATLDAADEFDAVLVGEPYDGAVIGRQGARKGPAGIRRELAWVKTHHFDAGPVESVGDLGSMRMPEESSVSAVQSRVRELTGEIHDAATVPVFLGGDNSLTMPNVAPLLDRDGSVGVVNLDAHLDCRAVEDEPSSGTPYRQLLEAGLDQLVVVGARHFETSTAYADYLRANDGEIVTAEEVGDDPVAAANRALSPFDVDHFYVSVDIDVLDASTAPGVSAPTPGGLSTRELFRMVRLLVSAPELAGFEVVETAPPLCSDGRTVAAAARTVAHALATARGESQ